MDTKRTELGLALEEAFQEIAAYLRGEIDVESYEAPDPAPTGHGIEAAGHAELLPAVHLDDEVLSFVQARAQARGVSLDEFVNELLKKNIDLIEAAE